MAIRKTPAGTYEVKVYMGVDHATGKEKFTYKRFSSKQEAKRFEAETKRTVDDSDHKPPSEQTVAQYLADWLDKDAKPNVKRRTFKRYEEIVRVHIVPVLGHILMVKLNARDVAGLLAKMKGQTSEYTRLHVYRALHRALNVAVEWGIVGKNVCDGVKPPKPGEPELQVLENADVDAFLRTAASDRLYTFFLAAVMTGMRLGELCGLRWQDVNLQDGFLTVAQALDKAGNNPLFTTPKNGKRRQVPLAPELADGLAAWQLRQQEERAFFGSEYADYGLVFTQPSGRPLDPHSLTRNAWNRLRRAAGLPDGLRFHDLRHTFISRALQAGANPRAVSEIAGHHDAGFTLRRYAHVTLNDTKEAVGQLQEYLASKRAGTALSAHQEDSIGNQSYAH